MTEDVYIVFMTVFMISMAVTAILILISSYKICKWVIKKEEEYQKEQKKVDGLIEDKNEKE